MILFDSKLLLLKKSTNKLKKISFSRLRYNELRLDYCTVQCEYHQKKKKKKKRKKSFDEFWLELAGIGWHRPCLLSVDVLQMRMLPTDDRNMR